MKKMIGITVISMMLAGFSANAQEVTKDSVNILKQEKESLEISQRLNENKLKLAKLENTLEQKNKNVSTSANDAQDAAADNAETAKKLNNHATDKKLAKRARKDARRAERAAKKGRVAVNSLDDLQSDIKTLREKIAEDEAKLMEINNKIGVVPGS